MMIRANQVDCSVLDTLHYEVREWGETWARRRAGGIRRKLGLVKEAPQ